MVCRYILVFTILLISVFGISQPRRFKHLTSTHGISQSEIYTFLEDKRGFMWFGTVDGLNRYDGYNIEIFNTNINSPNSLSNNTIRGLVEDELGRIWIGTDDGLNLYDPGTELIYQVNTNLGDKKLSIWSLCIHNTYLLIGTTEGLYRINLALTDLSEIETQFEKVNLIGNNSGAESFIKQIIKCNNGGIWIIATNSISRIVFQNNDNEPVVIVDVSFSQFGNYTAAVEDLNGNLWIASADDGLLMYNPVTKLENYFNTGNHKTAISSLKCSSLALDKNGNLWIGTLDKGLNFVQNEDLINNEIEFEKIQNEPFNSKSLSSNLIYSLYVSNDNLLWVGTIGAGVNIFNPEQKMFDHYMFHDKNGELANSNFIRSVYVDNKNRLWTGTHGNGLLLYDREKNSFQKLGFQTVSIFYIYPFNDKQIFICCGTGLFLVELVNNSLKIVSSSLTGTPVFNIVKGENNVFWVACLTGLVRLKIVDDEIVAGLKYNINSNPGLSNNNCRVLYYDKSRNMILAGTEGGGLNAVLLDKLHYPEKIKVYKKNSSPNAISNNYVRSIIKDKNRNIWVGTYEGLNKLIPDSATNNFTFKTYLKNDGLSNNMIQLIVEDDNQNLWIGTNGGLIQFNPQNESFINYTVNDGIQSNEFSEHTVFKKADGEIIMGGINGISAFYPEQIKISSLKPKTTITGFYLFNEKVSALKKIGRRIILNQSITLIDSISLLPKQKNIGFEFSAMIYPNAEKIKYAYILDGFDKDWHFTDAKNRIANYTNLRHGKYTFKVKSTNSDGIWEDSSKQIFIHIQTPFMLTWFAYVLYFLVIVLIFTYFSHYTIIRYTTKKKLLLEKNHSEKLHELDVLRTRFFINISHDLRTPLTLIRGPLDVLLQNKRLNKDVTDKLQLIKRNVKRLNYLIEQLLDVRKAESGKLTAKHTTEDLITFTNEEVAHFTYAIQQKGLTLSINTNSEKIMVSFDRAMMSKVYFNIISNAIKFTDKGKIEITIEKVEKDLYKLLKNAQYNSYVKVEFKDSGKGISKDQNEKIFERFYQGKTQSGNGYGIGLSHTKELIDAHNGFIEVESTENVGTTIRFFIPDIKIANENDKIITGSTEDMYVDAESATTSEFDLNKQTAKTILIVEDNADMRNFIKSELKKEYNVIGANDGLEGWKAAVDHSPDLIVCDVMMPNMSGIELCDKIKSNIETSHIPFILLTAKVDLETKYDGIKTGADDYIPKPFEMEYLFIRIKNLLDSREKLRKLFQKSHVLEPSVVTVTSVDEKFLKTLMEAVEEGIADSDFSINTLESKMAMSHAKFYRKIKSLTGQSGQELLLNMRMKRARQILSDNKGLRVAEVAYMVGFTNPKYFSKCFKETFGIAPSEFIR